MLEFIWEYMEYIVLLVMMSQVIVYYRLYLEHISLKQQVKRINSNFKFIHNNEYAIRSINKYIDDKAFEEVKKKSPNLTFYP